MQIVGFLLRCPVEPLTFLMSEWSSLSAVCLASPVVQGNVEPRGQGGTAPPVANAGAASAAAPSATCPVDNLPRPSVRRGVCENTEGVVGVPLLFWHCCRCHPVLGGVMQRWCIPLVLFLYIRASSWSMCTACSCPLLRPCASSPRETLRHATPCTTFYMPRAATSHSEMWRRQQTGTE